jgi:hypothetical protein
MVQHTFTTAGSHTLTLEVTTGSSATASKMVTVQVANPPLVLGLGSLTISPKAFGSGATVSFSAKAPEQVLFVVARCLAPKHHARKCSRTSRVRGGKFKRKATRGRNHFHLGRRLGGHALKAGDYVLTATPIAGRRHGRSAKVRFRIV